MSAQYKFQRSHNWQKIGLDLQMDLQNGLTFFVKWTYKTRFWTPSKIEETAQNFELNPKNRRIEGRKLPYPCRIDFHLIYLYSIY